MNTIRTESPTPARTMRRIAAALHALMLRQWLRAARDDAKAYRDQAAYCQTRAVMAEKQAVRLQRRIDALL